MRHDPGFVCPIVPAFASPDGAANKRRRRLRRGCDVLPASERHWLCCPEQRHGNDEGRDQACHRHLSARAQRRPPSGKIPILIDRSPYNKSGIHKEGIFFAQHGYVVIAQDCRGRFASEGKFYPLLNEGQDGYDAIEWAAAQPWSNGKVGTLGASYGAWTQYTAAMLAPPHLVAMFPVVGGSEFFPYPGGVPSLNMSQWILYMAQTSKAAENLPKVRASLAEAFNNPNPWLKLSPVQRGEIFSPLPDYSKIFRDMYTHPTLDSYWEQQNFYPAGSYRLFKDVPMYFISGWYDGTWAELSKTT